MQDANNKSSPDSGYPNDDSNMPEKGFYENLPFHGIHTANKNKPTPGPLGAKPKNFDDNEDEVTYADADYKDIYEFGPVSYKNASKEAAAKKKKPKWQIVNKISIPQHQSQRSK